MPIRLTGLNSGLDTESLVSALVSAYRTKTEKYTKAQTKLSWKQTAWSELNKKVNTFYKSLDALRFTSAYKTKKVNVSDATKVNVTATEGAVNGTQSLEVKETAKAGYLTGANLGSSVRGGTKLSELGIEDGSTISVTVKGRTTDMKLSGNMTVDDLTNAFKDAGIKASFDSANHRFFLSAGDSGKENDFSLTAANADGMEALKKLGLNAKSQANIENYENFAKYALDSAGNSYYQKDAAGNLLKDASGNYLVNSDVQNGTTTYDAALTKQNIEDIRAEIYDKADENTELSSALAYADAYKGVQDTKDKFTQNGGTTQEWDLLNKLINRDDADSIFVAEDGTAYTITDDGSGGYTVKDDSGNEITGATVNKIGSGERYELTIAGSKVNVTNGAIRAAELEVKAGLGTYDAANNEYQMDGAAISNLRNNLNTVKDYETDATPGTAAAQKVADIQAAYANGTLDTLTKNWKDTISANKEFLDENSVLANDTETPEMLQDKVGMAVEALDHPDYSKGSVRIDGTDAVILLNGAEFTSSSNNFEINGLSINTLAKTDGEISITTDNDVQGLYDKIKDFLSSYNSLINEMTSLYNAGSAKGYEPLTDEERDAMSDTEIEKWEDKIKSSLLRRDDQLGSIMNLMTNSMAKAYEVNGKKVSLATFGIATLGIFDAAENQQNAYHIYGDEDDASTASKDDKLMAALKSDPDSVIEFMKQLTDGLYKAIDKKMGSTQMSSKFSVYNDKEMAKEYSDYTDTISKWEEKLKAQEDYYYKKFSAMETALAKLQSQQSQLSGLLGM